MTTAQRDIYCTRCGLGMVEWGGRWWANSGVRTSQPWIVSPLCQFCRGWCPWCPGDLQPAKNKLRECIECQGSEPDYDRGRVGRADPEWIRAHATEHANAVLLSLHGKRARRRSVSDTASPFLIRRDNNGHLRFPAILESVDLVRVRSGAHRGREMARLGLKDDADKSPEVVVWPELLSGYIWLFEELGEFRPPITPPRGPSSLRLDGPTLRGAFTVRRRTHDERDILVLQEISGWPPDLQAAGGSQ